MTDKPKEQEKPKASFWSFLKPRERIMNNKELQAELKIQNGAIAALGERVEGDVRGIYETISEIKDQLNILVEVRNIPAEWERTIRRMKELNPDLPDIATIFRVLMAYKNLNKAIAKSDQEETHKKLEEIKTVAVGKKVHNCGKCGKTLQDGEYYKLKGKVYCLEHRKAKPKTSTKKPEEDAL